MKKILLTLCALMTLTIFAGAFPDVPDSHWAYDAVTKVSEQGLVKGYPDGSFQPGGTLTRAEFLTMCVRASLGDRTAEKGEAWWQPYYDAAVEAGWELPFTESVIFQGITRFEISSLLRDASVRDNQYGKYPAYRGEYAFTDEKVMRDRINPGGAGFDQTAYSMCQDTEWAVNRRLITGYPDGTFRPDNTLTRAEAAAVLYRLTVHNDIAEMGGTIAVVTDDFVIYTVVTQGKAEVISKKLPEDTEIAHVEVNGEYYKSGDEFLRLREAVNGNSRYFWGQAGFYEYFEDGSFKQLTDTPVLDYGFDAADNSFVLIGCDGSGWRYITSGGVASAYGACVYRLTAAGELQTLLSSAYLADFKLPEGEVGGGLSKVHYATGGKVQVECVYNWGMADLHRYVLEVKDGAASWVQMGAGSGYSY